MSSTVRLRGILIGAMVIGALAGCSANMNQSASVPAGTISRAPKESATPLSVAAPSRSADASFPGVVIGTRPSDPLVVLEKNEPYQAPSMMNDYLSKGWSSSGSWYARITQAMGPQGRRIEKQDAPGAEGWTINFSWAASGVKELNIGVILDADKNPQKIECSAAGFDPESGEATRSIAVMMKLCASADFPGAKPSAAVAWVSREQGLILVKLRSLHKNVLLSPTPNFGSGSYWLGGSVNPESTMVLYVR
jgi:hypothetical protein